MTDFKIGCLFPAFASHYLGYEEKILSEYSNDFPILLRKASSIINEDLNKFNSASNNFLGNELRSQFIAYTYSCAISNILKKENKLPDYVAGYSMGLYAALYYCNSILFEDGLKLIKNAFDNINSSINNVRFGMATVVGLEFSDLDAMIAQNSQNVEIINSNSTYNHVISGIYSEVNNMLDIAKTEGALYTRLFNVSIPYHSKFMTDAAIKFKEYVRKINVKEPSFKLISPFNQQIVKSKEDVMNELVGNINNKINWHKTMNVMISAGTNTFMECGAGNSLYKIGKFIEGDFKFYPINKLSEVLRNPSWATDTTTL